MSASQTESNLNNIVSDQLQKHRPCRLLVGLVAFSFLFFVAMHSLAGANGRSDKDIAADYLNLANRYYNGDQALPRDDTLARENYEKAAEYYSEAQRALAAYNYAGWGGPKDLPKALYWAERAAKSEQPPADCQFMLGVLYAEGMMGVPKDSTKAVYWFEKAATHPYNEFALAQYYLGKLYREGQDVPKDLKKSMDWFEKAFSKRIPQELVMPQEYLEQNVEEGEMIFLEFPRWYYTNNPTPVDYRGAREWAETGAEQDDADSQFILGLMYQSGKGIEKDSKQARHWLEQAAKQGHARAQHHLDNLPS